MPRRKTVVELESANGYIDSLESKLDHIAGTATDDDEGEDEDGSDDEDEDDNRAGK